MPSVDVLGVRVHDVTEVEALAWCANAIQERRPHLVVTPNAEFVMRARREPRFRDLLNSADLAIPDGSGLLLAGRILGTPLREQVTGTDLLIRLASLCAVEGWRIYLLGAEEGVAEAAARTLQTRFPGLVVAGTFAGSPREEDEAEILRRIRAAAPVHVLVVAYGAPAQEHWLARNLPRLDVRIGLGVGGALDFISGRVPRAPVWVRRAGFDWLYRLARQPWRWRRQLALPRFVLTALWARARRT
jgi:N-acetylglucosaminyldiphosphoundecaprenol N-acetyl-beta-D-mannosaminyltransferase